MSLIFNASPLIVLAKSGLLNAVLSLTDQVIVPRIVANEINNCNDSQDPARIWLQSSSASGFIQNSPEPSEFVLAWGLGAGESSVIALTETLPGSTAVLDDLAGRRCAAALGLCVVGTIGLLLKAKRSGRILNITKSLEAIVSAGLFISEKHLAEVRRKAGE